MAPINSLKPLGVNVILVALIKLFASLVVILVFSAPEARASISETKVKKLNPRSLKIEIHDNSISDIKETKIAGLEKACESFSVYMTRNRGLWASGPYAKSVCKVHVNGKELNSTGRNESSSEPAWRLIITSREEIKTFQIFFQSAKGTESLEASYEFSTEIPIQILLEKHEFAQLISAYLSNSIPIRTAITGAKIIDNNSIVIKARGKSTLQLESHTAEIFQIRKSGNIWITKLIGSAEIKRKTGNRTQIKILRTETDPVDEAPLVKRSSVYFLQQINDREANLKRIDDALRTRMGTFFSKFLDIGRSAYVGMRYGIPAKKGRGVLANTNLLGIFGEFRGGILSGLRINYDSIPTQKLVTTESTDEFSWSRFQLGYGFGMRFNNPLINWIDFSPKLGVTNLLLRSTAAPDALTEGYEFHLQRAPTVGLEVGIEKRTNEFLLRLWGYGSYSLGVLPIDKEFKSTSLRAGIDIYREVADWRSIKLAVLVFSAIDRNNYTRLISTEELAENPNTTTEVTFGSLFAGGGVTLTW